MRIQELTEVMLPDMGSCTNFADDSNNIVIESFLQRDAMGNRGLRCRPVSVRHVRILYPGG